MHPGSNTKHTFYSPNIQLDKVELCADESQHLSKVLRLKPGDSVRLMDGKGGVFEGEISISDARKSQIVQIRLIENQPGRPWKLHIAISPPKMMDRLEWFIEKATEIGIDEISFLKTTRGERNTVNMMRIEKILRSAMKQSLNAYIPVINPMVSLNQFLHQKNTFHGFIAHCLPGEKVRLSDFGIDIPNRIVLIGPEGDFTPEEIRMAKQSGYKEITLSQARLRTETSALTTCVAMSCIFKQT